MDEDQYLDSYWEDRIEMHDGYWEDHPTIDDFDGEEPEEEEPEFPDEPPGMTDVEADADTLASAGYGTDEDYGYFGCGEE